MRETGFRGRLPVRAEINVTSLVDVAFTLLVIFIITAPVLQGGVEVNVPEGRAGVIEAGDDRIIVSVTATDSVFFGTTYVPTEDVAPFLARLIREADRKAVYVKGDTLAAYGRVYDVISVVVEQEGAELFLIVREESR